jgi:peptidyl-prolyl cis-trans isomerase SurA
MSKMTKEIAPMTRTSPLLASVALCLGLSLCLPAFAQIMPQKAPAKGTQKVAKKASAVANIPVPSIPSGSPSPVLAPAPAPQAKPPEGFGEGVVATVNDTLISSYDLRQRMLLLIVTSGVQVTEQNYQGFQQQALRALIDEHLQQAEMKRFELEVKDDEIDEEIGNMAQQSNLSAQALLNELKRMGVDPQTLRTQIRSEIGWNQLVNGRFRSKARIGKDQVDSYMEKLTEQSQKPQYLVAEIYIDPAVAGGPEGALAGANQLFDQITKGVAPFQSVARQFSNAPSAANGGDAGWLVSGTIDPKIESVLKIMAKGQLTKPIVTDDGVYIYYLRERSEGNADSLVHLRQASITLGGETSQTRIETLKKTLAEFRSKTPNCNELKGDRSGQIQINDLGETPISDLKTEYAEALRPLKVGQSTPPMANALNVNILYVCDKALVGEDAPSRDMIERRLMQDKVAMLGRRYLRDIRVAATIENR